MKKGKKLLQMIGTIVFFSLLAWWMWPAPTIQVFPLNKTLLEDDSSNSNIFPPEKLKKNYPWLIIVSANFSDEKYRTAFNEDAVKVMQSGGEVSAKIYTANPDTARLKKYLY